MPRKSSSFRLPVWLILLVSVLVGCVSNRSTDSTHPQADADIRKQVVTDSHVVMGLSTGDRDHAERFVVTSIYGVRRPTSVLGLQLYRAHDIADIDADGHLLLPGRSRATKCSVFQLSNTEPNLSGAVSHYIYMSATPVHPRDTQVRYCPGASGPTYQFVDSDGEQRFLQYLEYRGFAAPTENGLGMFRRATEAGDLSPRRSSSSESSGRYSSDDWDETSDLDIPRVQAWVAQAVPSVPVANRVDWLDSKAGSSFVDALKEIDTGRTEPLAFGKYAKVYKVQIDGQSYAVRIESMDRDSLGGTIRHPPKFYYQQAMVNMFQNKFAETYPNDGHLRTYHAEVDMVNRRFVIISELKGHNLSVYRKSPTDQEKIKSLEKLNTQVANFHAGVPIELDGHLWQAHLFHGDLKLENVLTNGDGSGVSVTDFGFSRILLSRDGMVHGIPQRQFAELWMDDAGRMVSSEILPPKPSGALNHVSPELWPYVLSALNGKPQSAEQATLFDLLFSGDNYALNVVNHEAILGQETLLSQMNRNDNVFIQIMMRHARAGHRRAINPWEFVQIINQFPNNRIKLLTAAQALILNN